MSMMLYALEIDKVQWNKTYDSVPLHCTLMHWFRHENPVEKVLLDTYYLIEKLRPIEIESDCAALFGPKDDTPVHVLRRCEVLHKLHMDLYERLHRMGAIFTSPQWIGRNYRPHVTTRDGRDFPPGTRHTCQHIILYDLVEVDGQVKKRAAVKMRLAS